MERSGHLSKEGLPSYEHTSWKQKQIISDTLSSFVPTIPNTTKLPDLSCADQQILDETTTCTSFKVLPTENKENEEPNIDLGSRITKSLCSKTAPPLESSDVNNPLDIVKELQFSDCTVNINMNF